MKRFFKIATRLFMLCVASLGLFVMAARNGWLRPDEASLRARYALPASRFINLGRQQLHVVDEGRGPAIILVHGSYGSLRMWDAWADQLKDHYRVIRFDRPGMGLSGPAVDGRYDGAAEAPLIGRLADRLGVARFHLVATSSAGEAAASYAATHPERVAGLLLANVAAGPIKIGPHAYPLWFAATLKIDPYLGGWHMPSLWRGVLEQNFSDPAKVTPALVTEWTELNNRAQGWPRKPRPDGAPPFAGTPADLAKISAPTLLLWSRQDPEVSLAEHGEVALNLLGSRDKALQVIEACGHMMPIECGDESGRAARAFFDRLIGAAVQGEKQ